MVSPTHTICCTQPFLEEESNQTSLTRSTQPCRFPLKFTVYKYVNPTSSCHLIHSSIVSAGRHRILLVSIHHPRMETYAYCVCDFYLLMVLRGHGPMVVVGSAGSRKESASLDSSRSAKAGKQYSLCVCQSCSASMKLFPAFAPMTDTRSVTKFMLAAKASATHVHYGWRKSRNSQFSTARRKWFKNSWFASSVAVVNGMKKRARSCQDVTFSAGT